MPKPHPKELRERVVAAYHAGEGSFKVLAKRFRLVFRTLRFPVRPRALLIAASRRLSSVRVLGAR